MNLALDENRRMIRDAAESFLADVSDSAAVRRASESDAGYDPQVWKRIGAELGWCGVAIAEERGGLGLGPVELALVFEQCGRRLLCSPFFATVALGASLVSEVGSDAARAELLPRIAAGELTLSASLDDWASLTQLPDVIAGTQVLFFALDGLFIAPPTAVRTARGWDATRRLSEVEIAAAGAQRIDDPLRVGAGRARALALARACLAAEQLGAAQQCLDLTTAYVATRKQFGRAIASFQAVKHRCAQMMVQVEALRSLVYGAAASGDPIECAAAKAQASDTLFFCAQEAIQLHGGVGFTWEYDPQLYFKRAQASSRWLGTPAALRAEVAGALLGVAA